MPRHPYDREPDKPGGRALERLQDTLERRFPGGMPPDEASEQSREEEPGDDEDVASEQYENVASEQYEEVASEQYEEVASEQYEDVATEQYENVASEQYEDAHKPEADE